MKLLDAVRAGDISVVKYLLKDGADVNAKNEDGHTVRSEEFILSLRPFAIPILTSQ